MVSDNEGEYHYAVLENDDGDMRNGDGSEDKGQPPVEPFYAMPQDSVKGRKPLRIVSSKKPSGISNVRKLSQPVTSTPILLEPTTPVEYAMVR